MPNKENLVGKGFDTNPQNINTEGRKKGSQNRNTVARQILGMEIIVPGDLYKHFVEMYPTLPKKMSIEQVSTLSVMKKAINDGEYLHYKAIMDSAYGAPIQEIDMTSEGERINPTITVINNIASPSLANSEKDVTIE